MWKNYSESIINTEDGDKYIYDSRLVIKPDETIRFTYSHMILIRDVLVHRLSGFGYFRHEHIYVLNKDEEKVINKHYYRLDSLLEGIYISSDGQFSYPDDSLIKKVINNGHSLFWTL